MSALLPWIIVCIVMLIWGNGIFKSWANSIFTWNYPVPELHNMINKVPPVAANPTKEGAVFAFTYLSFTGTGMLLAAIVAGFLAGFSPVKLITEYGTYDQALRDFADHDLRDACDRNADPAVRHRCDPGSRFRGNRRALPVLRHAAWLAGCGADRIGHGIEHPVRQPAEDHLRSNWALSPVLMAAANSSGGVMGKMIDAQSIVVASTATNWYGHEGTILRFVFKHSIALACLVGLFVMLQAYVYPFTAMVLK